MMDDPLLLGQRVVAILETGQRDATYKLATLSTRHTSEQSFSVLHGRPIRVGSNT